MCAASKCCRWQESESSAAARGRRGRSCRLQTNEREVNVGGEQKKLGGEGLR